MEEIKRRTDKNKELYKKVDAEINKIAKHQANEDFSETNNRLSKINEGLFQSESINEVKPQKETIDNGNKRLITTAIVCGFLFVVIVIIAVVISYGK